ncbi:helix-turn-helix transcriptional regulator [Bradyrhizobium sp. RT4b]|uniref:helix-turn-helix transcriptional regulator n=1 Tax=Bradyrhizobium sp. RT4b TaxID=3156379 RepID=UPI0033927703
MRRAGEGKFFSEVVVILEVGGNTVNFHLKNAVRKLEVTSRIQWAVKARRFKLIERRMADTANPMRMAPVSRAMENCPLSVTRNVPSSDS